MLVKFSTVFPPGGLSENWSRLLRLDGGFPWNRRSGLGGRATWSTPLPTSPPQALLPLPPLLLVFQINHQIVLRPFLNLSFFLCLSNIKIIFFSFSLFCLIPTFSSFFRISLLPLPFLLFYLFYFTSDFFAWPFLFEFSPLLF